MVLVLFDSPAGHCLFHVVDAGILKKPDAIWDTFASAHSAKNMYASLFAPCTAYSS